MEIKSWFASLVAGWFGPSFIKKHVTTLLGVLAGLLVAQASKAGIPTENVDQLMKALENFLVPFLVYLLGLLFDGKPETPKVVNK